MARRLHAQREIWPIKGSFRIARGAKTEAHIVMVSIEQGRFAGRGECVPYARYGESVESVLAQIEEMTSIIEAGMTREALQDALPAGAARNALDCALLDLEAKSSGVPAHRILGLPEPRPVQTAFTLSLDTAQAMGVAAREIGRAHV